MVCFITLWIKAHHLWKWRLWKLISDFFICVGGTLSLRGAFLEGHLVTGTLVGAVVLGTLRNFRSTALALEPLFWGEPAPHLGAYLRNAIATCLVFAVSHYALHLTEETCFLVCAGFYVMFAWTDGWANFLYLFDAIVNQVSYLDPPKKVNGNNDGNTNNTPTRRVVIANTPNAQRAKRQVKKEN